MAEINNALMKQQAYRLLYVINTSTTQLVQFLSISDIYLLH